MFFGKKQSNSKNNKKLNFRLLYEQADLRLDDGTLFNPLEEAIERWVVTRPAAYAALGISSEILYELPQQRWIRVDYYDCHEEVSRDTAIIVGDGVPSVHEIEPIRAAHFLLDNGIKLTQDLRQVYNEWVNEQNNPKPVEIRPLEYWIENRPLEIVLQQYAHEVNFNSLFKDLCFYLLELDRSLTDLNIDSPSLGGMKSSHWARTLHRAYPVDSDAWDWSSQQLPPEKIDLLDLDWPDGTDQVSSWLRDLRVITDGPLFCLAAVSSVLGSDHFPTEDEQKNAIESLIVNQRTIHDLVTKINVHLRNWLQENQDVPPIENPAEGLDEKPIHNTEEIRVEEINNDEINEELDPDLCELRIVRNGFYLNGRFQRLTQKPLKLLRLMAQSKDGLVTYTNARDKIWEDAAVQPAAINKTISIIRLLIRKCLFLNETIDPIPCNGTGFDSSWNLDFQYRLVDDYEPQN